MLKLTEAGRKTIFDDTQMDDRLRLVIEVTSRVEEIDQDNLIEILETLEDEFGSDAAAIEAIKRGDVRLTQGE